MLPAKRGPGRPPNPDVRERERKKQEHRERQDEIRNAWKQKQQRLQEEELEQNREVISELRAIRRSLELIAAAAAGNVSLQVVEQIANARAKTG